MKRLLRITMRTFPAFAAASRIAAAFLASIASGFSQKTCLPALHAAMAISLWRSFGVQMSTASIDGSLSSSR